MGTKYLKLDVIANGNTYRITREDTGQCVTYPAKDIYDLLDKQLMLSGYRKMITKDLPSGLEKWEVLVALEDQQFGDVISLDKNPVHKLYLTYLPEYKMIPSKLSNDQIVAFIELLLESESNGAKIMISNSSFKTLKTVFVQSWEGSCCPGESLSEALAKHIITCMNVLSIEKVRQILRLQQYTEESSIYDSAT